MAKEKVKKKPKLLNMIVVAIFMLVCSLAYLFYNDINNYLTGALADYFGIVSVSDDLLVHYISVGQGDAIAVNLPDGQTILIDAGPSSSASTYVAYVEEKVLGWSVDNSIDYFFLTHADADHIGGALTLINSVEVENVFLPVVDSSTKTYTNLVAGIQSLDINVVYDYDLTGFVFDGYSIEIFGPLDSTDTNDACPVIKISYKDRSFLFTGDISEDIEDDFVASYGTRLQSDVLKIAHHGSQYSSSADFLSAVSPTYAVISVGSNSYGHPTDEALERISAVGATIYRTDISGNVMFAVGANYDLAVFTGDYTLTTIPLDIKYLVLIIDGLCVIYFVVCIIRFKTQKN